MRLTEFLDKGASLRPDAPCLTMAGHTWTYSGVQRLSWAVGRALDRSGVRPGDKVAVLSGNDPVAFGCVFGIARAGAVWCPVNPRIEAAENQELLDLLDCRCLIYARDFAPLVTKIITGLPKLQTLVCLDEIGDWLAGDTPWEAEPVDDVVLIAGTAGTTGKPKGVMLTGRTIETMTALILMSYPFRGRPVYLAFAPLTYPTGVLSLPVMALGGEIVLMPCPDLSRFLTLAERHRVTHAFLRPTVIYRLLGHPELPAADLSSLQCLWYGGAPMPAARLEQAIGAIGPVMGQLFGQTEAPMMISALAPDDHVHPDGTLAAERFTSAGKPTPLTTVAIMDDTGTLLCPGQRGEIVVRGPLVMAGYYKDPSATAEASRYGWHHTGDIGYLDDDGYLHIVDRRSDMIITGGFNVYSTEVEQALLTHPRVMDCAVVGLPDEKWGERVTAVVQLHPGQEVGLEEIAVFVREKLGGVKTPKQVVIWPDLPRSRVGKVLKSEVRLALSGMGASR